MHNPQDTASCRPAKSVWKIMQMRALGSYWKLTGIDFRSTVPTHFICKTSVGRKNHEIMQVMFYVIFQPYYCTAVKTVKCTIQRTSSADSLRKPFENPCRCAHLPTACVGAIILLISLTHWVRSLTTTREVIFCKSVDRVRKATRPSTVCCGKISEFDPARVFVPK